MNTVQELEETLRRVTEEASAARAFFYTWRALDSAKGVPESIKVMNDGKYVDFFLVSLSGNFRLTFISLAILFDMQRAAMSVSRLKTLLRRSRHSSLADRLDRLFVDHEATIMGVRRVRNNVIAHMNRSPEKRFFEDAAVTPNQIADLIDALCETLNDVARKFAEPTVISDGDRNERAVHCLLDTLRNVRWASHHDH